MAGAETTLGAADDVQDADGGTVLSLAQAQQKARAWFAVQGRLKTGDGHVGPYPWPMRGATISHGSARTESH